MLRAYETVARDVNHPSIVVWSIGNEDPLTTLHMAAIRTVKGLDPTRPVLMPWRLDSWLPPEIDIRAPHYLPGPMLDGLIGNSDRPFIATESVHAYGNDGFGDMESRWKFMTRHPQGAGGAIWMWADQGIKPITRGPDGKETSSLLVVPDGWDGITDSYRNPTRDYWEAKAVYAQVSPAVQAAPFVAGQPEVLIPIQNDFDFTDLADTRIVWALMEDDRQLAGGRTSISAKAHSEAVLRLPTTAVTEIRPDATYYMRLTFERADGSEIATRSVELQHPAVAVAETRNAPQVIADTATELSVQVGTVVYRFDRTSGLLAAITRNGVPLASGLQPTIWHALNPNQQVIFRKQGGDRLPDLNKYTPAVTAWSTRSDTDRVIADAAVTYSVNDKNKFQVQYRYEIGVDGKLTVHYSVLPNVEAPALAHVGMEFGLAPEIGKVRWLGLGPYDAYPNESAAPYLGVWGGALGSPDVSGTKATRWVELTDAAGGGLRIANTGYMTSRTDRPGRIQILSTVAARPTKWPADDADQKLPTGTGKPYVGQFTISVLAAAPPPNDSPARAHRASSR
jgi:beta-galactosidase